MVLHAKEHGNISLTAEFFQTSRDTVYKWLKRYDKYGYSGLIGLSTKPHHSPNTTPEHIKKRVIAAKEKYCRLGAVQIKVLANLPVCPETIRKICREANFKPRKRVKKHVTKQNLRKEKMKWKLFQQIDVDVKHLGDIPNYYFPIKMYCLPAYQYTARDVTSGLLFRAFAYEKSLTNSVNFANYLNTFLKEHNIDLSKTTIQTDNGSEFIGAWNSKEISVFTRTIHSQGQEHITIPADAHRYQADVETFHNIEEV